MRAVLIESFRSPPRVAQVSDPVATPSGVVVEVGATGLCRSDWHGWQGHDADIVLPHVPGHEFAGTLVEVGRDVPGWRVGQRVVVPFICACGDCDQCRASDHQVCTAQQQPGFTYWGSFAEYVAVPHAAVNLVALPDELSFDAAAALGCRFATSYRAVTAVGAVRPGEWLVVFGAGGVGLSAVTIAAALGARVIAVDPNPAALAMAADYGATHTVDTGPDVAAQLRELTGGGADVTLDAIGAESVVQAALNSLRPRGRHVQVGLLPQPLTLDLSMLASRELAWLGSHGLAAHDFGGMLELVASGAVRLDELVTRRLGLDDVADALVELSSGTPAGIAVIHPAQR